MEHLEIELKFFIADLPSLRQRIATHGAHLTLPRTFEHNVRYETQDARLLKNRCLLRLRQDRATTLTFKAPPLQDDPRFKIYRELEVRVSDFATMDAILVALGFSHRQIYQKWRETWQLDGAMLCLDEMPFGTFLEIEGAPDTIRRVVATLGLAWPQRIRANYLKMFETLADAEQLPFRDVTFENFANREIDFDRYRHYFEAGKSTGKAFSETTPPASSKT